MHIVRHKYISVSFAVGFICIHILSTISGVTDNLHPHKNRLACYSLAVSGAEVRLARRYEDGAASETPIQEKHCLGSKDIIKTWSVLYYSYARNPSLSIIIKKNQWGW